jgi:hypothetical protein
MRAIISSATTWASGRLQLLERMVSRLQLTACTKEVPASIYQLTKGTVYVSEDMARPIEMHELTAY